MIQHKATLNEETNDLFGIDIFMWALGTQNQNGLSQ